MNAQDLRAQHPELYRELIEKGIQRERDRVCAHLTMGSSSGALDVALDAIRSGDSFRDPSVHIRYVDARLRETEIQIRQAESDLASLVTENIDRAAADVGDIGDQVCALLEADLPVRERDDDDES